MVSEQSRNFLILILSSRSKIFLILNLSCQAIALIKSTFLKIFSIINSYIYLILVVLVCDNQKLANVS